MSLNIHRYGWAQTGQQPSDDRPRRPLFPALPDDPPFNEAAYRAGLKCGKGSTPKGSTGINSLDAALVRIAELEALAEQRLGEALENARELRNVWIDRDRLRAEVEGMRARLDDDSDVDGNCICGKPVSHHSQQEYYSLCLPRMLRQQHGDDIDPTLLAINEGLKRDGKMIETCDTSSSHVQLGLVPRAEWEAARRPPGWKPARPGAEGSPIILRDEIPHLKADLQRLAYKIPTFDPALASDATPGIDLTRYSHASVEEAARKFSDEQPRSIDGTIKNEWLGFAERFMVENLGVAAPTAPAKVGTINVNCEVCLDHLAVRVERNGQRYPMACPTCAAHTRPMILIDDLPKGWQDAPVMSRDRYDQLYEDADPSGKPTLTDPPPRTLEGWRKVAEKRSKASKTWPPSNTPDASLRPGMDSETCGHVACHTAIVTAKNINEPLWRNPVQSNIVTDNYRCAAHPPPGYTRRDA